ncbi:hypothetical protein VNO80_26210 [Phaseolus coccineus]|uniref:Uncharacterized protein n=1 Tax=Phaseolus coccineus TaxID=3886 RepID=A0AAN9LI09_PHACN
MSRSEEIKKHFHSYNRSGSWIFAVIKSEEFQIKSQPCYVIIFKKQSNERKPVIYLEKKIYRNRPIKTL